MIGKAMAGIGRGFSRMKGAASKGYGATKRVVNKRVVKPAKSFGAVAGPAAMNIGRGMGQAVSQTSRRIKKGAKAFARTPPKDLASSLGKMARNPKKMKSLGKKLAKYGAAGAAGYYMGKD